MPNQSDTFIEEFKAASLEQLLRCLDEGKAVRATDLPNMGLKKLVNSAFSKAAGNGLSFVPEGVWKAGGAAGLFEALKKDGGGYMTAKEAGAAKAAAAAGEALAAMHKALKAATEEEKEEARKKIGAPGFRPLSRPGAAEPGPEPAEEGPAAPAPAAFAPFLAKTVESISRGLQKVERGVATLQSIPNLDAARESGPAGSGPLFPAEKKRRSVKAPENCKRLTVNITDQAWAKLQKESEAAGKTITRIIEELVMTRLP